MTNEDIAKALVALHACLNILGKGEYLFSSKAYTDLTAIVMRYLDAKEGDPSDD